MTLKGKETKTNTKILASLPFTLASLHPRDLVGFSFFGKRSSLNSSEGVVSDVCAARFASGIGCLFNTKNCNCSELWLFVCFCGWSLKMNHTVHFHWMWGSYCPISIQNSSQETLNSRNILAAVVARLSRMIFPVHRFRQLPPGLCRTVENVTENRPLQFRMYPVPVGEGLAFPLGKNGTCIVERKFIVSLNFSYRSQNLYFSANP